MKMFNRLVAYGCSHTAGSETQDEDYVPNADLLKKQIGWREFIKRYDPVFSNNWAAYVNAGKEKSFIKHLANKLNVPYENRAIVGSGSAEQIYLIEKDLAENQIKDTDLVIVGITGKERLLKFNNENNPETILLAHSFTYPDNLKVYQNVFLSYFDDKMVTFQMLMHYQYFLNLANTKLKNRLYFAFCDSWAMRLDYNHPELTELPESFKHSMKRLHTEFCTSEFNLSKFNLYTYATDDRLHGGNHVKEIAHIEFADELYKNLINKLNP